MKIVDRQIQSSLDGLHREMVGPTICDGRWKYDARQEEYSCPHLSLKGSVVIGRINDINHFKNQGGSDEVTATI